MGVSWCPETWVCRKTWVSPIKRGEGGGLVLDIWAYTPGANPGKPDIRSAFTDLPARACSLDSMEVPVCSRG